MDEVSSISEQVTSLIRLYKVLGGGWPTQPGSDESASAPAGP